MQENNEKIKNVNRAICIKKNQKTSINRASREKTITVLNNQMKDEQEKIYLTYLAQAKKKLQKQFK